jgi:hypothetical protein
MSTKRVPARDAANWRDEELNLAGASVRGDDLEWMARVERLNTWNVTFPDGFLSRLPRLWWLKLIGGSGRDLSLVAGCDSLRFLSVNQVLGMADLGVIGDLRSLQFLELYGLPRVRRLPSLATLVELRRVLLGSMKGLEDLAGLFEAPQLEELLFGKMVRLSANDIELLLSYAPLKAFDWFLEDIPSRVYTPVLDRITVPTARSVHPEVWFKVGWGRDL